VRLRDESRDVCVANLHLTAGVPARAEGEARRAAATAVAWAGQAALIVGGDFNLRPRETRIFDRLEHDHGLAPATGPGALDHLLARGLDVVEPPHAWAPERRELDVAVGLESRRLRLSDHAPVEASFGVR
jgi:endonuclease/exonuclease/phosphatase family metal-dependent hydrolase